MVGGFNNTSPGVQFKMTNDVYQLLGAAKRPRVDSQVQKKNNNFCFVHSTHKSWTEMIHHNLKWDCAIVERTIEEKKNFPQNKKTHHSSIEHPEGLCCYNLTWFGMIISLWWLMLASVRKLWLNVVIQHADWCYDLSPFVVLLQQLSILSNF